MKHAIVHVAATTPGQTRSIGWDLVQYTQPEKA